MLLDLVKVLDKDETDFEIGCKCKDVEAASGLSGQLRNMLQNYPGVEVRVKEEVIVSIVPKQFVTLLDSPAATPCV